jgi:hypothetical protein
VRRTDLAHLERGDERDRYDIHPMAGHFLDANIALNSLGPCRFIAVTSSTM